MYVCMTRPLLILHTYIPVHSLQQNYIHTYMYGSVCNRSNPSIHQSINGVQYTRAAVHRLMFFSWAVS